MSSSTANYQFDSMPEFRLTPSNSPSRKVSMCSNDWRYKSEFSVTEPRTAIDQLNREASTPLVSYVVDPSNQPAAPKKENKPLELDEKTYNPRRLFVEERNSSVINADYLDEDSLLEFHHAIDRLEAKVIDTFKSEVNSVPLRSFRTGPSRKTLRKARYALAVYYKRLARTIRRLGFHEHAIVVPQEVRDRSVQDNLPYLPVEEENWRVGCALYETRSGTWYEKEFENYNNEYQSD